MLFNSFFFFLTLIPLLVAQVVFARTRPRLAKVSILFYSLCFYAVWNPWFLLCLVFTTCVDYRAALAMRRDPARKRLYLAISLISNLGVLGFFKYYNFFVDSIISLGVSFPFSRLNVLLPVGLSFYTFEALSYTIDVYRGTFEPRTSLLDVALFVSYFPHLVAGPIVRARILIPQFERAARLRMSAFADGTFLIVLGLFLKCVIADGAAQRVSALFGSWQGNGAAEDLAAAMLFSVQIYGDFAGYSSIAIGLARVMGYYIPVNFRHPYGALGFSDFWRRWHISLSTWLRDYLYIPLGGNRRGTGRGYLNLMITMLLGGLWHGASLMFVTWGALHGIYLCVERALRGFLARVAAGRLIRAFGICTTFLVVSLSWIPFRATDFAQCEGMLRGLFRRPFTLYHGVGIDVALVLAVFLFDAYWARRDFLLTVARDPALRASLLIAMLLGLYFYSGEKSAFIYFQF